MPAHPSWEPAISSTPTDRQKTRRILLGVGAVAGLGLLLCCGQFICLPTLADGVLLQECPDGDLRQTIHLGASGLQREATGSVWVDVTAHYMLWDSVRQTSVRWFDADLELITQEGETLPVEITDDWDGGPTQWASVKLPAVPDGDHILRVNVASPLQDDSLDVPLPLYAPARIHALTDRPLYQPGDTVNFRALTLRARDRVPLGGRPGRWLVRNPSGEVLLEEKATSSEWGVTSGDLPLDSAAAIGTWTVTWRSGADEDIASFTVEPFTLPRFRVEARPEASHYSMGDVPRVTGTVRYSSGAPVADAAVDLSWRISGGWPAPTSWLQPGSPDALPSRAVTDARGRFALELPMIPADLQGIATLQATLRATDPAGDVVTSAVSVLLSADAVAVSTVTELDDGLVAGFDNRMYLRVTTPSGQPLPGADLKITRAWEPRDPGLSAQTDADGVAAVQIDPGPPVNVMVPAAPYRPPPPPVPVTRTGALDLHTGSTAALGDQLALDRTLGALEPCARWVQGSDSDVTLGVRVAGSGRVSQVSARDLPLDRCLADALTNELRLPAGAPRVLRLGYRLRDPDLPTLALTLRHGRSGRSVTHALESQLRERALDARGCLPADAGTEDLGEALSWSITPGRTAVAANWQTIGEGGDLSSGARACVRARFSGLSLPEPPEEPAVGVARVQVREARRRAAQRPKPTVMLGYELNIAASIDGESIGDTVLRMTPGTIPPLRLRASSAVAAPGETVTVKMLRGPDFNGWIPEKLWLIRPNGDRVEAKVDEKTRVASWRLPGDAEGWYSVSHDAARALVFVPQQRRLTLDLTANHEVYAPGDAASVTVRTSEGEAGAAASVTLVGVDESLAQLAPLPGADDLDRLYPQVTTPRPAFGVLDGQALSMGRIQGEAAAAAAVLRVASVPTPEDLDARVSADGATVLDLDAELVDTFYQALGALHARVRTWERDAPEGEKMGPLRMAEMWGQALDDCTTQGISTSDPFGRGLRLHRLPSDLLALTDPRAVVVSGTRLPEDIENWARWVAEERP